MIASLYAGVEASGGANGGRTAVEDPVEGLDYASLLERAEQVAGVLRKAGPASRCVVGLMFEPSVDYVIGVLGVRRAGHVFLPLNGRFPGRRIVEILESADARLCLGSARYCEHMEELHAGNGDAGSGWGSKIWEGLCNDQRQARFCLWQAREPKAAGRSTSGVDERLGSQDACYVISTSGSTGRPKLILGSERGLLHFLEWEIGRFGFNADSRGSFLSNVTFDVSLRDMFAPLLAGGRVCIPDETTRITPARLLEWLERQGISHMHIVPTLLRALLSAVPGQATDPARLELLRYALIAGEPLYGYDVSAWRTRINRSTRLVNLYGPSETTLAKCFCEIGESDVVENEMVPVGAPIPDTEVFVVKEDGEICGPGEGGEVYLATPFMSLGYLNAAEEETGRFIRGSGLPTLSPRVYRTGDMGRRLPSGLLQLQGRKDGQVKLHGNRIELAEIEVVLRLHPQVSQAAAAVKRDRLGNDRLVGYIVPKPAETPTPERLRGFLQSRLPQYMIPAVFVFLTVLPVTHSNKLDREKLPGVPRGRPVLERAYQAPQDETEGRLARIWRRLLDLEEVGVEDSFFELGGTSMLAGQFVARFKEEFGTDLPATALFQYPTIRRMARSLQVLDAPTAAEDEVGARAEKRRLALHRRRASQTAGSMEEER